MASYTWLCICLAGWLLAPHGAVARSLIAAPLIEEIVFRWGVQDALAARLRPGLSVHAPLLAALLFALAHVALAAGAFDALRAAATFVPAWWLGIAYRRDGALSACVAWHAAFNLAWIAALQPWLAP